MSGHGTFRTWQLASRMSALRGEAEVRVGQIDFRCPPMPGFNLYMPSRAQMPTKMRAFIEGLVPHERKNGFVMPFISELKTTSQVCSLEVSKTLNRNLGSGTVGPPGPSQ